MPTIIATSAIAQGTPRSPARESTVSAIRWAPPYVNRMLTGEDFDRHCHSNLVRAVLPFGLTELDVHDVLNVFQCTGLNDEDRYFMKACPAKPGDFLELLAEVDLLCALSTCPGGDLSVPLWGPDAAPAAGHRGTDRAGAPGMARA